MLAGHAARGDLAAATCGHALTFEGADFEVYASAWSSHWPSGAAMPVAFRSGR
jgi:hypothetical protein